MHTTTIRRRLSLGAVALLVTMVGILTACSSDETTAPETGHTPASVKLFVNDVDVTADLVLAADATTRVEVRFYDDHGDLITGIEEHHHTAMTFTPSTLAVAASVPDHNFQLDVTAQSTSGAGTVMVGYGHDAAADELTFGPFTVTVP